MYDFRKQLNKGKGAEDALDAYFCAEFEISRVDLATDKRGIDRIFKRRSDGLTFTVQYKADWKAAETGNAFVETVSMDTTNAPGWAYSCRAKYLLFYVPPDDLIYVWKMTNFRWHFRRWLSNGYQERRIPNKGYHTVGILVPLAEFERYAEKVINAAPPPATP